eukprot:2666705-Prorocentrum_lima.AAC.1
MYRTVTRCRFRVWKVGRRGERRACGRVLCSGRWACCVAAGGLLSALLSLGWSFPSLPGRRVLPRASTSGTGGEKR